MASPLPTKCPVGSLQSSASGALKTDVDAMLVKPIPFGNRDARDVSASSREGLRREVKMRRNSLTVYEHHFLEDLAISGNEIEVNLAIERLADGDLFFESDSPEKSDGTGEEREQQEQQDGDLAKLPHMATPKLRRVLSLGSVKRLQVLEQRKQCNLHGRMWKAHESGLAVTQSGSRRSLLVRENSSRALRQSSIGSSGGRPPSAARRRASSFTSKSRDTSDAVFRKGGILPTDLKKMQPDSLRQPVPYRRSQSVTYTSQQRPSSMMQSIPGIPEPRGLGGRSVSERSTGSRKSVSFQTDPADLAKQPKQTPPMNPKLMPRSISDSIQSQSPPVPPTVQRKESNTSSVGSFASIRPATAIRSDSLASIGSVPSIHHAHPIRSESIGSIPSIHHAHPLRQDSIASMGSIPSLRHGHPLRSSSAWSMASEGDDPDNEAAKDAKTLLLAQYAAADSIADIWANVPVAVSGDVDGIPYDVNFNFETPEGKDYERDDTDDQGGPLTLPKHPKSVLMRLASRNLYEGEGIEVEQMNDQELLAYQSFTSLHYRSMPSMGDLSIKSCSSWDECSARHSEIFRTATDPDDIFRGIRKSFSEEDMSNLFLGSGANLLVLKDSSTNTELDDSSWDMHSDDGGRFDSWNVIKDEYVNGYGGGGTLDFRILGTSADDELAKPHVLSPPLMESLQAFLPFSKSGENFYLKYSLLRDGASLHSFLKRARGTKYSILAMETVDGEVFGSFTAQAWRKNWNYFGTGESFLFKMRKSRLEECTSIIEQAQMESEIDVYPYTGENKYVQLCTHDRIAVGGGSPSTEKKQEEDDMNPPIKNHEWGFGLSIANDMLTGTSSPCITFGSPSLSKVHSDGSVFEIVNMELWTLTPCYTTEEAEKMELGKLFLERESH